VSFALQGAAMSKRTEKKEKARRAKREKKRQAMMQPGFQSKYAQKNRPGEIARGYSNRPASPFFLPESMR
jgi:hypothetical protein